MQIVDINTAARVWMVLPGKKAAAFRSNLADLFIRVLGGDETLATEIKEIGEFQDTLPDNHPLKRAHGATSDREATTSASNVESIPNIANTMMLMFQRQFEFQKQQAEDQKEERRQQFELQKQQFEHQKEERRQHIEDQREERRHQFELQKQQLEIFKTSFHSTTTRSRAPTNAQGNDPPTPRPARQPSQSQKDLEGFRTYLRHFFSTSEPFGEVSVSDLTRSYNAFARNNNLEQFTTRQKIVRSVNSVSTRLLPQKREGRISGWIWGM